MRREIRRPVESSILVICLVSQQHCMTVQQSLMNRLVGLKQVGILDEGKFLSA